MTGKRPPPDQQKKYKTMAHYMGVVGGKIAQIAKQEMVDTFRTFVGMLVGQDGLSITFAYRASGDDEYQNQEGLYMALLSAPLTAAFDDTVPPETRAKWQHQVDLFNTSNADVDTKLSNLFYSAFVTLDPFVSLYAEFLLDNGQYTITSNHGLIQPNTIAMGLAYGMRAHLLYNPEFGEAIPNPHGQVCNVLPLVELAKGEVFN
jgi:hypothetical protein